MQSSADGCCAYSTKTAHIFWHANSKNAIILHTSFAILCYNNKGGGSTAKSRAKKELS